MHRTFIFENFLAKVTKIHQAEWNTLIRKDKVISMLVDIAEEI